uniref:Metal-nicotianamine transporter YSL7 n=1 Tax=Kalanchoe fedtschenkoi TaxID=63787 RepID=A0A7N0ULH9_KALFE
MTAFLFLVSFAGLFSIAPLRKTMILKYKLTYPSGTATAYLMNSFHTPRGAQMAKKQVTTLFKSFCGSFAFAFFRWFFAAADGCGFSSFPTFGLQAYAKRFYFDFSATYVGVGMICPYIVNISMMIGAILSWGVMWPLIEAKKGHWYKADLKASSLHGIQGYRVFCAIAMMLGDGLFQVVYMLIKTGFSLYKQRSDKKQAYNGEKDSEASFDEQRRVETFLKDQMPNKVACLGYVLLAILSIVCVPFIFPQLKWYHILVVYLVAPVLAFCNAYGCGLTDWALASNYGKIAIIGLSAWVGLGHGGIIAGLAGCGLMMNIVSTASDLMQDFKTGYLTLSSPRSMFVSQVIGTAMGCVSSPLVFWIFHKAYSVGDPTGSYPAPYGLMYRGMALLGAEGISSLPDHCLEIAIALFALAILLNVLQQILQLKKCEVRGIRLHRLILFFWRRSDKKQADDFHPALASGLICGESLWGVPAAVLAMAGLNPPICMKFLSAARIT